MLSAQFENGSGLVFAAARLLVFVRWLPAATVPPRSAMSASTVGEASPRVVTAINAPPTGRIAVWSTSHTVSTYGILSAKNSIRDMTTAPPMTQSLSQAGRRGGEQADPARA